MTNKTQRECMLECLILEVFDLCPGIYPKAVVGKYKKRNEYQNGWNACEMERTRLQDGWLKDLAVSITDEGVSFI